MPINLRADGVGQVADHENVLDVVVEVVLDLRRVDLGGQGQRAHKVLSEGVVGLLVLVQDAIDPLAHPVEEVQGLVDRPAEALDRGSPGLVVLRARDGLEGVPLGVTVEHLVGHLDEEAAVGGALSVDGHGGADVASRLDVLAGLGRNRQVNGGVGERARLGAGEEVLDKGAEAVELVGRGVPAEQGLAGVGFQGQGEHVLLVLDVDLDLVLLLGVRDGEAGADLDLGSIFGSGADQGADDSGGLGILVDVPSHGVVEDGEDGLSMTSISPGSFHQTSRTTDIRVRPWGREGHGHGHGMYLRLDVDAERGNVGLDAHVAVSQRAREMYEALGSGGHAGRECVVDERRW
ncbi:hypothetical protein O9K51_06210 [Purpureocillium lavendulum]|uniref:Uncharacterized protein n=1 Tax=Purpureocillium lavendulum TaxID=1247861 RepID=A0AB34FN80_9HYPO|nr:hypothetical protein O9K51_06210 [Purpureocillium lavendulum]